MIFRGIDLTQTGWNLAAAIEAPPRNTDDRLLPYEQSHGEDWRVTPVLQNDVFWQTICDRLMLKRLSNEAFHEARNSVIDFMQTHSAEVDQALFGAEARNKIHFAFAFPYQTPRLVLNYLHHLFNYRNPHPETQRSAIEAPIALILDAVARKQVDMEKNPTVFLLTGMDSTLELTAAAVQLSEDVFKIKITAHVALDPTDVGGSLKGFAAETNHAPLFHAGNSLADLVSKKLAETRGQPIVQDLGRHAVAIGAVRHVGMLCGKRLLGNHIRRCDITRYSPVALGILGTNCAGEWFWRKVLDRGEEITTTKPILAKLNIGTEAPETIAFTECPNPAFASQRWLAQRGEDPAEDGFAEAGLRWHDLIPTENPPSPWDLQFKMKETFGNHLRWVRCPGWTVVPRAPEVEELAGQQ